MKQRGGKCSSARQRAIAFIFLSIALIGGGMFTGKVLLSSCAVNVLEPGLAGAICKSGSTFLKSIEVFIESFGVLSTWTFKDIWNTFTSLWVARELGFSLLDKTLDYLCAIIFGDKNEL